MIVREQQTVFDVCLKGTGSLENVLPFLNENDLHLDQLLEAGEELEVPEELIDEDVVVDLIEQKFYEAGTEVRGNDVPGGIGYIGIEFDFIVS